MRAAMMQEKKRQQPITRRLLSASTDQTSRHLHPALSQGVRVILAALVVGAALFSRAALAADSSAKAAKASSTKAIPVSSQPRVFKKPSDFGIPEVAMIDTAIEKGWSD